VDRVGDEIEHERRAFRHARFRAAPPAAGDADERESGRQQRDSPSHAIAKLNSFTECEYTAAAYLFTGTEEEKCRNEQCANEECRREA
jgi:hypothetical protein